MDKYQNSLLGIAIGDAFGAGYEMMSKEEITAIFDFTQYLEHPHPDFNQPKGSYTDDTQMSIAIAELLAQKQSITKQALASAFIAAFKRDPINGYARGFQKFLEQIGSGDEFLKKIRPKSERNGAAMRAVPFGIEKDLSMVIKNAITNAQLTHNTPKGIASSICVAVASHYFFHTSGDHKKVGKHCASACKYIDEESSMHFAKVSDLTNLDEKLLFGKDHIDFGVSCDGMRTAGAAIYILRNYWQDPNEVLKQSVLLGGDTDSVASIALGISATKTGLDSLPSFLLTDLRNNEYGRDYIIDLAKKLKEVHE